MGGMQSVPGCPPCLIPGPNLGGYLNQTGSPQPLQPIQPAQSNQLSMRAANQNYGGNFIPGFMNPALIPYGLWQNMQKTSLGQTFANPTSPGNFNALLNNASNIGLSPNYLKSKKESDLGDYLDGRKYFAWKQASRGNIKDWDQYGQWKENVWNNIDPNVYITDFKNWKKKIDPEDAQKWKEWNDWKKIKDESKKKNLRKRNHDYDKNKRAYQHFVKRADLKSYGKFVKFQEWVDWAKDQGKNIDDINTYYNWSDNYIYNVPLVRNQYEEWKNNPNPNDFQLWVKWMKWDKMRKESQTTEDNQSEQKRGKGSGKKYKEWYKNEFTDC